jgi:hypothetical protein
MATGLPIPDAIQTALETCLHDREQLATAAAAQTAAQAAAADAATTAQHATATLATAQGQLDSDLAGLETAITTYFRGAAPPPPPPPPAPAPTAPPAASAQGISGRAAVPARK